jgi:hypothetical protein
MTRRFLDNVRSDINTQIVTNTNGDITAVVLAPLMIDTIDSSIQDESRLLKTVEELAIPITTVYTAPVVYDSAEGGDATFLKVNLPAGTITTNTVAGFTYDVFLVLTFIGIQNTRYDATFLLNGVAVGLEVSAIGFGINDPTTIQIQSTSLSTASDSVISVGIKADIAGNIDLLQAALRVDIMPTNNP